MLEFFSSYLYLGVRVLGSFYEPHILSKAQLEGLPWPVVNSVFGPPLKTTQDRKWIKDIGMQSIHTVESFSTREKSHGESKLGPPDQ